MMDVEPIAAVTAAVAAKSSTRVGGAADQPDDSTVPPSLSSSSSSLLSVSSSSTPGTSTTNGSSSDTHTNDDGTWRLKAYSPPLPLPPPSSSSSSPNHQHPNGTTGDARNGFDDDDNNNNNNNNHVNNKNDLLDEDDDDDDNNNNNNNNIPFPVKATSSTKPNNNNKGPATLPKRLILFLLVVFFLSLYKVTSVGVLYSSGTTTARAAGTLVQSKNHSSFSSSSSQLQHRTALVMRTMAPIPFVVLERIHNLALELNRSNHPYDFWILVDETRDRTTTIPRLHNYFAKSGHRAVPPQVFSVSETALFQHYPRLISYANNYPELNYNNETGVCCGRPIMWQMFIPTFGLFLNQTRYEYAWTFEDDIGVHGALSLLDLIRVWDLHLGGGEVEGGDGSIPTTTTTTTTNVDLAAIDLQAFFWGRVRHTWPMEDIVRAMQNASVEWRLFSDAVQRHSVQMADAVVQEVSNNVMQFGERLIHPIAWKHNLTIVDLAQLAVNHSVYGALEMTGAGKLTSGQGVEKLLNLTESPSTFLFHEELPGKRRLRQRQGRQQWRLLLPKL